MMAKCRCILHEFSITTSTSTTKMMMIITMATMLINKRKLCQPQNVCIVYVFAFAFVCAVHFLTVYFWFFIYNLFCSCSLVGGCGSGCRWVWVCVYWCFSFFVAFLSSVPTKLYCCYVYVCFLCV